MRQPQFRPCPKTDGFRSVGLRFENLPTRGASHSAAAVSTKHAAVPTRQSWELLYLRPKQPSPLSTEQIPCPVCVADERHGYTRCLCCHHYDRGAAWQSEPHGASAMTGTIVADRPLG